MNGITAPIVTTDRPDAEYLTAALARSGQSDTSRGEPLVEPLHGGRTGVAVSRLQSQSDTRYVLKQIPRTRAIGEALGHEGEGMAWLQNLTRSLPRPLMNPALDVALNIRRDEWWLLMTDVSAGVQSRAQWGEDHTRRLFEALADFHALWWEADNGKSDCLASLSQTTGVLAEVARYVTRGSTTTPWAARVAKEFQVPAMLLPDFLSAAGEDNASFYNRLLARWPQLVDRLNDHPATLLHGDLRRANIAFVDHDIALFDWEFVARGPAAVDLTWHWFLHFWAYPPNDGCTVEDRWWLRDAYLSRLEKNLRFPLDVRAFLASWDLGWLRVFCQLGFVLADGLSDQRQVRTELIRKAFEHARRIAHEHLAD